MKLITGSYLGNSVSLNDLALVPLSFTSKIASGFMLDYLDSNISPTLQQWSSFVGGDCISKTGKLLCL